MADSDDPDFGFLNEETPATEPTEQFSFGDAPINPEPPPTPGARRPDRPQVPPKPSSAPTEDGPAPRQVAERSAANKKNHLGADQSQSERGQATSSPAAGKPRRKPAQTTTDSGQPGLPTTIAEATVPKSQFLALAAFAALVSVMLLLQLLGVIRLGGTHQLESLPDVAPLKEGEFQAVPETASLPSGHELRLGQDARFGDIIFTPTKVVLEPLSFVHMTTGKEANDMKSRDVLKLYFTIKNVSDTVAFPPWDVALMSHRSPMEGLDESTKANSWLQVSGSGDTSRVLNFFHSPKSSFNISGMQSRITLQPDESRSSFIASSEGIDELLKGASNLRWRIQLRKGVNQKSNHSVTTLVDVSFSEGDIQNQGLKSKT